MARQEIQNDFSFQLDFSRLSDEFDDGLFYEFLPFSDLKQWIPEGGIYEDFFRNTPMARLGNVHALSFLSYVGPEPEHSYFIDFPHDRFDHSLTTALVMEKILRRNNAPEKTINTGIIAGLSHDIATPALGDATMQVDPQNLDEEKNWKKMLSENGGPKVLDKYHISVSEMEEIIKNKGLLGKILDIADRITYTMKDLHNLMVPAGLQPSYFYRELNSVLHNFPDIGNIYKDVEIDAETQEVYFKNPDRLKVFLTLRAHLHEGLYLHPVSQGRDLLVKKLIEELYSSDSSDGKPLNPKNLRRMTDNDLKEVLYQHNSQSSHHHNSFFYEIVNWYPEYNRFDSQGEAQAFESSIKREPNIVVLGIKERRTFNPGTGYMVKDQNDGKIVSFRDYNPEGAKELEEKANSLPGFFVYYKDLSKVEAWRDSKVNALITKKFKGN